MSIQPTLHRNFITFIKQEMTREFFIKQVAASSMTFLLPDILFKPSAGKMIMRTVLSTGEKIPAIGMGSWITFDVDNSGSAWEGMRNVLRTFVDAGGTVIDSSPMYGRSEKVIGQLASESGITDKLWFATKVWTNGEAQGKKQIGNSVSYFHKWPRLLQVHNLQDVKTHLRTLRAMKENGTLKYIGITHYLDSQHRELADLVKTEKLDFIQVNLSVRSRSAEDYLIPLAADKGVSVIINRPFETGALFSTVGNAALPGWAKEWDINTWPAFFLKYIISNENVTCTIPATSQVAHVKENMAACFDPLPDKATRKKMVDYYNSVSR